MGGAGRRLPKLMSLTTREKQFYDDNGYLLRKGLVPLSWIANVEREVDRIHERMAKQPAAGVIREPTLYRTRSRDA